MMFNQESQIHIKGFERERHIVLSWLFVWVAHSYQLFFAYFTMVNNLVSTQLVWFTQFIKHQQSVLTSTASPSNTAAIRSSRWTFVILNHSSSLTIILLSLHRQYRPQIRISECSPNHQFDGLVFIKQLLDKLYLEYQTEIIFICCFHKFMFGSNASHFYLV